MSRMLRSGSDSDDAPALGALHDLGVIEARVEAEQAELESRRGHAAAPWQAPWLQPAFVRIGTISRLKLTGMSAAAFATFTGIV